MSQVPVGGENSVRPLNPCDDILVALGGNLTSSAGSPYLTLKASLKKLHNHGAMIRAISAFYDTPAFPKGSGPNYVNAAARISAPWSPSEALEVCHAVEHSFDRRRAQRWGQRTLDIDIIAQGNTLLPDVEAHRYWRELPPERQTVETPETLVLPHPRMQDRAFVLVPLADVAPDWVHPVLNLSVTQMLAVLDPAEREQVRRIE